MEEALLEKLIVICKLLEKHKIQYLLIGETAVTVKKLTSFEELKAEQNEAEDNGLISEKTWGVLMPTNLLKD